jgi:hypothetical protein
MSNLPPHTPFTRRRAREDETVMPRTMQIARKPPAGGMRAAKGTSKIGMRQRMRLKGSLLVLDAIGGGEASC